MTHYLFVNYSAATEWFVWDLTQNMVGMSIITAWILYKTTPFWYIGTKLTTFIFLVMSIVEFAQWLISGGKHTWVTGVVVFVSTILFVILKAQRWNMNKLQSGEVTNACIVFCKPHKFLPWLSSLFGFGVGSCYFVVNGYKYSMGHKMVRRTLFSKLAHYEFCYDLNLKEDKTIEFGRDCDSIVGKKFSSIDSNCLTAFKEILRKNGHNTNTILPSIYFKNFVKNA